MVIMTLRILKKTTQMSPVQKGEMVRLDGLDHQGPLDYNIQLQKTIEVTASQFIPFSCYCADALVPLSLVEWLWK